MSNQKKPAVIAKRGRPVGSKNKVKDFPVKDKPVDWEKLAKRLQEALATQIKEADSYRKLWEEFESKLVISEQVPIWRRIKFLFVGRL